MAKHLEERATTDANDARLAVHWKEGEGVLNICPLSRRGPVGFERFISRDDGKLKHRSQSTTDAGTVRTAQPAYRGFARSIASIPNRDQTARAQQKGR